MNTAKILDLKLAVNHPINVGKEYFYPLRKAFKYLGVMGWCFGWCQPTPLQLPGLPELMVQQRHHKNEPPLQIPFPH